MSKDEIVVTGIGMVSPVGLSAPRSLAAIRAGITRFVEHPHYTPKKSSGEAGDEEGERGAIVAPVLDLDPRIKGPDRLLRLALLALQALVHEGACERRDLGRAMLLAALPAPDDVVAQWGLGHHFIPELNRRGGLERWAGTEVVERGAPGALQMMERARAVLTGGRIDLCVVLAADTYLGLDRLIALDQSYRLKSPRNVDGFIPGEGAVALLIETAGSAASRGAPAKLSVRAAGFGVEPMPLRGEGWSTGKGLSDALRPVIAEDRSAGAWTLSNLNGESYRAREWGIVTGRLADSLPPAERLMHPADTIGDIGAAMGAALVGLVAHLLARGHAPASSALIWATSDDASRAALAVEAPG